MSAEQAARNAQQSWNEFTSDQAVARAEFDQKWRAEKAKRKDVLAENIKSLFAQGKTVPDVSRITGNSNHTFLYGLRNEYKAGSTRAIEQVTEEDLEYDFEWEYHEHTGVHGWLIDGRGRDIEMVKVHGQPGTEHESEYAIFRVDGKDVEGRTQIAGSASLAASISDKRFGRGYQMLHDLLDGMYDGPVRLADNPFTK